MRYSLGTLLLLVLWFALGMTVWMNRAPWKLRNSEAIQPESYSSHSAFSPDGTRIVHARAWGGELVVLDVLPGVTPDEMMCLAYEKNYLYEFKEYGFPQNVKFIDNDTIEFDTHLLATNDSPQVRVTFERRFPEWWWGHFFRVEVWFFVLTGIALLVRGIRSIRERKRRVIGLGIVPGISPASSLLRAGIHG